MTAYTMYALLLTMDMIWYTIWYDMIYDMIWYDSDVTDVSDY